MSDWGETFEDRLADAGYLACAIDEDDDHVTLVEAPVDEVIRIVRIALLSDEAVLRALNAEEPRAATDDLADWGEGSIDRMRAALAAALGEDGE